MQHDVYVNPAPRTRRAYPFVAVLQADISAEGRSRDREFHLTLEPMTSVPTSSLREPLGSTVPYRDQITRALDWLFTGV